MDGWQMLEWVCMFVCRNTNTRDWTLRDRDLWEVSDTHKYAFMISKICANQFIVPNDRNVLASFSSSYDPNNYQTLDTLRD